MKSSDGIELAQALIDWLEGRIKKGSPRELQARRLLAHLLRYQDPLVKTLRGSLADAVDPEGQGPVQLSLNRKRGRQRKVNPLHIAIFVHRRMHERGEFESAVKEAMTKFKVSRGTVTDAWKQCRQRVEHMAEVVAAERTRI
jgi:hypothetical protein